jgi:hypothetical protein
VSEHVWIRHQVLPALLLLSRFDMVSRIKPLRAFRRMDTATPSCAFLPRNTREVVPGAVLAS